jgi:hypothetical protein
MKLYYHPISTTSRPLVMFAADNNIDIELKVIDLLTGEHVKPPYLALNPSGMRQRAYDCRLPRRRLRHDRRYRALRFLGASEYRALVKDDEGAPELGQGEQALLRHGCLGQGEAVRRNLRPS